MLRPALPVSGSAALAENAQINLNRVAAMRVSNAISQKDLDNARAQYSEASAKLRSNQDQLDMLLSGYREEEVLAQKAAVAAAAAALNHAEIQLRDAVLAAPQKGIVLTRAREAGAIVQAGQTVYTLTLTDPLWLRAYVDEPNLGARQTRHACEDSGGRGAGQKFFRHGGLYFAHGGIYPQDR